jgi:anti-sigma factor RsiW
MSCSPFDLRDYLLGELRPDEHSAVERHARTCPHCQDQLDRLRITQAALLSIRDEEIPQRIAFVSDKVFEPSALRRWFAGLWNSAARAGFASAALLAGAIVYSAWTRPAPVLQPAIVLDVMKLEQQFETRLQQAVAAAVTETEARQDLKMREMLARAEKERELGQKALMLAVEENFEVMRKRLGRMHYLASASGGAGE